MSVSVTMPALGESVTEGTVTRWLKQVGDTVAADEPLVEISTDKVDTEIPSPAAGVLLAIRVGEDETIAVGAELAVIGEASESAASSAAPAPVAAEEVPIAEPAPAAPAPAPVQVSAHASEAPAPAAGGATIPAASGAMIAITLPALGESVTEGTVTRWLKQVGDAVAADEPLLEISTDKVDTEIPAPASGTLVAINVAEDSTVAVGTELGLIATGAAAPAADPAPAAAPAAPQSSAPAPAPAAAAAPEAASAEPADNADAYVTPLVRRLAAQEGIDLSTVTGTGVGGRVRKQDVLAASAARAEQTGAASGPSVAPAAAPAFAPVAAVVSPLRGRTEQMPRLRRVIAERMVESLQTSAQLTT
ncbi:MAG: E3 binding domain-containing protein, partial [Actinobacteria bacterium]|nr:E3 binding domain-containing protein [Actinomycetota bacterium]